MSHEVKDEKESYTGFLTVSGLLSGFSFTAMISLMVLNKDAISLTVAFISFQVAAYSFVITTLGAWAILEWISEKKTFEYHKTVFFKISVFAYLTGFISFLSGITATSFYYSTAAATISVFLVVLTMVFFFFAHKESMK